MLIVELTSQLVIFSFLLKLSNKLMKGSSRTWSMLIVELRSQLVIFSLLLKLSNKLMKGSSRTWSMLIVELTSQLVIFSFLLSNKLLKGPSRTWSMLIVEETQIVFLSLAHQMSYLSLKICKKSFLLVSFHSYFSHAHAQRMILNLD